MPKKRKCRIVISKNGPYIVSGNIPFSKEVILSDEKGNSVEWKKVKSYPRQESYALCRCGNSKNKPYCDGSHLKGFDGTETDSKRPFIERAEIIKGPSLVLLDAKELCACARFCHNSNGRIWDIVKKEDETSSDIAIGMVLRCPSGRLVLHDNKGDIETSPEQSISIIEDPVKKVSGPLWVKGGVQMESHDGTKYEIRNRITLCRCGKSKNKPFCDCSHIGARFNDGDESIS